jgi:hypothetical protein
MKNNKIKVVDNWRQGWKWFSTWAMLLIVYLTLNPLPPEVMALLPPELQQKMVAVIALAGFVLRFISQSKDRGYD